MIDGRVFLRSRNLLYQDDVGRDACGIGGVAAREGRPSHEVVRKAYSLSTISSIVGSLRSIGRWRGLTLQLPQTSSRRSEAPRTRGPRSVRREQRLAVGVFFFFDAEPPAATRPRRSSARSFRRAGPGARLA